ncbi:hypothetical protein BD777DRAFT_124644 [Yarrowia lipolytica]|jgi:hypothetical protein|nr:hypothetical protein BD777DRAFT_124644 [Yarrowia lipolytica]
MIVTVEVPLLNWSKSLIDFFHVSHTPRDMIQCSVTKALTCAVVLYLTNDGVSGQGVMSLAIDDILAPIVC